MWGFYEGTGNSILIGVNMQLKWMEIEIDYLVKVNFKLG